MPSCENLADRKKIPTGTQIVTYGISPCFPFSNDNVFVSLHRTIGFLLTASLLLGGVGCNTLPNSGIDPTGERLFARSPFEALNPKNCELFNRRSSTATPSTTVATPIPAPATIYQGGLPGNLGAATPGALPPLQFGSTATPIDPGGRGINTALIASPDAGPRPVFADTGGYALPIEPIVGPAVVMTPREQIAPIGSEVVLIASYLGNKDRLITNEKIEWSLEGVGTVLKFDEGSLCDPLHCDFVKAKKVSERFAITKTSQLFQTLDRGTPDTRDDIHLLKGQTWVSVNSMREGTTHVTAFAPSMKDWSKRTDFGIIHWVDAQWVLPTLPIAPVGDQRMLTTVILRQSNGQPRTGWIVQYELLNGPAGGLGDTRAQIIEVSTDASGRAPITLSQTTPMPGTNTIAVRIIRPAGVDGSDRRVTVGTETLRQTWAGNPGVVVRMEGPVEIHKGQDIPYTITAQNLSASTASGVISLAVPSQASFVRATPSPTDVQSQPQGTILQWNVTILPNGVDTINLVLRQETSGQLRLNYPVFHSGAVAVPTASTIPAPSTFAPSSPLPASTYSSPTPPTPPTPPATGTEGVTAFPKVQVSAVKRGRAVVGTPCDIVLTVENTGSNDVRNVEVRFKLPPEYADRSDASLKKIGVPLASPYSLEGIDQEYNIRINPAIPLLPAGQKTEYIIVMPTIPQQGYTFDCSVLVNGQVVAHKTEKIVPD